MSMDRDSKVTNLFKWRTGSYKSKGRTGVKTGDREQPNKYSHHCLRHKKKSLQFAKEKSHPQTPTRFYNPHSGTKYLQKVAHQSSAHCNKSHCQGHRNGLVEHDLRGSNCSRVADVVFSKEIVLDPDDLRAGLSALDPPTTDQGS
jgi:hypothetical protein